MNWTTEKPKVPGWYWYKGPFDATNMSDGSPVVIRVTECHTDKDLRAHQPYMDYMSDLDALPGQWQGPLTPPE